MNTTLVPFDPSNFASMFAGLQSQSAFANTVFAEYNRIRAEDGLLEVSVNGQVVQKAQSLRVVLATYQHADMPDGFKKKRRIFYATSWTPNQKEQPKPTCQSFDGTSPDPTAIAPQSATCAECPQGKKDASGYTPCSYRKTYVLNLVTQAQDGTVNVDTGTHYTFDAPSKSMFTEVDPTTQSGGIDRAMQLLFKMGVNVPEAIVFELGFFQGAKAAVFRPTGTLSPEAAAEVIRAAKQPSVTRLTAPIGSKPNSTPAIAAPATVAQLAAPVAAPAPAAFVAPAPVAAPAPAAFVAPAPVAAPAPAAFVAPTPVAAPAPAAFVAPAPVAAPAPAAFVAPAPAAFVAPAPVAVAAPEGHRSKAFAAFGAMVGTK
jgi:hypothetical protein